MLMTLPDNESIYRSLTKDEVITMVKELKQFLIEDYCRCETCKFKSCTKGGKSYTCNHQCDEIFNL